MPSDLEKFDLQEGKTRLDIEIPLELCDGTKDKVWKDKTKIYCPSYRPFDMLYGDFNYAKQSWMRLIVHRCNDEERKKAGKKCATRKEQDDFLEANILYLQMTK
jgi:hypothetical protein|tara:strand:+ start:301 stop:612 length:312 start_codon:yes stop_codon:yes gene_type:complete